MKTTKTLKIHRKPKFIIFRRFAIECIFVNNLNRFGQSKLSQFERMRTKNVNMAQLIDERSWLVRRREALNRLLSSLTVRAKW